MPNNLESKDLNEIPIFEKANDFVEDLDKFLFSDNP